MRPERIPLSFLRRTERKAEKLANGTLSKCQIGDKQDKENIFAGFRFYQLDADGSDTELRAKFRGLDIGDSTTDPVTPAETYTIHIQSGVNGDDCTGGAQVGDALGTVTPKVTSWKKNKRGRAFFVD